MLSIITPTYRRNESLYGMLLNLSNQTNNKFEVIIVNDDPNNILTKDLLPQNLPFETIIINNKENKGPSESRNIGVGLANYDWVCFLDDDDFFSKRKVEVITNTIDDRIDVIYNSATIKLVDEGISYQTNPTRNVNLKSILSSNKLGGAPLLTVRKDTFLNLGGFDLNLSALEDYEFNIKVIKNNLPFLVIDEPLTECVYSDDEYSVSKSIDNNLSAIKYILMKYDCYYTKEMENELYSWIYSSLGYKSLLIKNVRVAFKLYFRSFRLKPKFKTLIIMLLININYKLIFKIRAKS
ncbi:TPA: glycosyltransferase family 2 protein [Photobacterium damselae]